MKNQMGKKWKKKVSHYTVGIMARHVSGRT